MSGPPQEMRIKKEMSNAELLKKLKSGGLKLEDLERVNSNGDTGLIVAARANEMAIVKQLLSMGVVVNQTSFKKSTAITAASMRGYEKIVEVLLQNGANVNQATNDGDTPISLAVWKNQVKTAMVLLDAKADTSRVDRFGDTVLIDAAKGGDPALVRRLVERHGLDVNHRNNGGQTPILCASMLPNKVEVIKILIQNKANVDTGDAKGVTPLMYAANRNQAAVCRELLKAKANPRARDLQGTGIAKVINRGILAQNIPGLTEAELRQYEQEFQQSGGQRAYQNRMGALISPPMTNAEFVQKIKEGKIDLSDPTSLRYGPNAERPLIRSCRQPKLEYVKIILDAKCDVNELNNKGTPPLVAACMRGFVDIAAYLLDQGARINHVTKKGDTAISLAVWKNQEKCAALLIDRGADLTKVDSFGDNVLLDAAKNGSLLLVNKLIKSGKLNLNHANKEGCTALLNAINFRRTVVAKALIAGKADPNLAHTGPFRAGNVTAVPGDTPLIQASKVDDPAIVQALLAARANPNVYNSQRRDAVSFAQQRTKGLFMPLRLKRQLSNEVDEKAGWTPLTPCKDAIGYICAKLKNESLAAPLATALEKSVSAIFIGDLLEAGPNDWDLVTIPGRVKRMLQEIVRVARGYTFADKNEEMKFQVVRAKFEARKEARQMKIDMYKDMIEMAIDDKVITDEEMKRIEKVRVKHELTQADHDGVLKSLGITRQQFAQFTRNKLSGGAVEGKDQEEDLMTCVVCMDARSDHVILNCMHLCLCGDCAPFLQSQIPGASCPKCRQNVTKIVKVFF